jgi:hypothetical protein
MRRPSQPLFDPRPLRVSTRPLSRKRAWSYERCSRLASHSASATSVSASLPSRKPLVGRLAAIVDPRGLRLRAICQRLQQFGHPNVATVPFDQPRNIVMTAPNARLAYDRDRRRRDVAERARTLLGHRRTEQENRTRINRAKKAPRHARGSEQAEEARLGAGGRETKRAQHFSTPSALNVPAIGAKNAPRLTASSRKSSVPAMRPRLNSS